MFQEIGEEAPLGAAEAVEESKTTVSGPLEPPEVVEIDPVPGVVTIEPVPGVVVISPAKDGTAKKMSRAIFLMV